MPNRGFKLRGGQNNFYAYVWNNPLGFKDPNGKQGVPGVGTAIDISIWLGTHIVPGGFIYYRNWGGPGWTGGPGAPGFRSCFFPPRYRGCPTPLRSKGWV
jgi:hypothetical protein